MDPEGSCLALGFQGGSILAIVPKGELLSLDKGQVDPLRGKQEPG